MDATSPRVSGTDPLERETVRRVGWRLLPLLVLGYFCASLDRSNVGMAAATMSPDLGFSNEVFGFGAGMFFWGYLLAEIPSNLMLDKVGARRWIARILITWGIVSGLTAFVWNEWSFYSIRVLLGLAEAGFYPGVLLYLTWWFPSAYRSRVVALFMSASTFSLIIGPPVGGLLLRLQGAMGMAGWQWLFILEALPPIVMCFLMWGLLTDKPAEAAWLRPEQRTWLTERLAAERAERESVRKFTLAQAFCNPKMWLLTFCEFGHQVAGYGLVFFLPLIVKGLGVRTAWVGSVSAVPYIFAFGAMLFWGWHSDRSGERTWHAAGALLLVAAGLASCILIGVGHPVVTMIALVVAVMGNQSIAPVFWSIPSALLTGSAAAGGIAMINSIGNLGGWFGPWMFGLVRDSSGSANLALLSLALAPVLAAIALVAVGHRRHRMAPGE